MDLSSLFQADLDISRVFLQRQYFILWYDFNKPLAPGQSKSCHGYPLTKNRTHEDEYVKESTADPGETFQFPRPTSVTEGILH